MQRYLTRVPNCFDCKAYNIEKGRGWHVILCSSEEKLHIAVLIYDEVMIEERLISTESLYRWLTIIGEACGITPLDLHPVSLSLEASHVPH